MLAINHFSDLHIHASQKNKHINQLVRSRLKYFYRYIYKPQKADMKVNLITGDIVDDGLIAQYKYFTKIAKDTGLEDNLLLVPGNHDYIKMGTSLEINNMGVPKIANYFYGLQLKYINSINNVNYYPCNIDVYDVDNFKQPVFLFWNKKLSVKKHLITVDFKIDKTVIIILDSNPYELGSLNFARGKIGPKQLKVLKYLLTQHYPSDYFKIVAFHHHPFDRDTFLKLEDADKLFSVINEHANLILAGHKHKFESIDHKYYFATNLSKDHNERVPFCTFYINNGKLEDVLTYVL